MMILKLAWKNMWRNSYRTSITMASIFFAVLLSILTSSLKTGIFDNLIQNLVGYYSGYIQVHKKGYWNEQILENSFAADQKIEHSIMSEKKITALAPRLESFALASAGDNTKGCMVVGVNPEQENKITALESRLKGGKYIGNSDNGVMLAEGLMQRLKLKLNDTIVLIGQGYHGATAAGKYRIAGIVKFGSPELNENTLFMSLNTAQEFFAAPNMLTSYVIGINTTSAMNDIKNRIYNMSGEAYEVMTWEEMMPDIKQHIEGDSNNMRIVHFILYILISFGIFSTMLVMMAERRREIGMLLAIGMRKTLLTSMLLTESIFTVLIGCVLGVIAAIPIVFQLHKHPIRMYGGMAKAYERFGFEAIFPTSISATHFTEQGIIVICIGLLVSLYPTIIISRLDAVKAMR